MHWPRIGPARKGQEPECCPPSAASGPGPPGAPVTNLQQRVVCTGASLTQKPRRDLPTFWHPDRHSGEAKACSPKFIINPQPCIRTPASAHGLLEALSTHLRSSGAPVLQEPLLASPILPVQIVLGENVLSVSCCYLTQETAVPLTHCYS